MSDQQTSHEKLSTLEPRQLQNLSSKMKLAKSMT